MQFHLLILLLLLSVNGRAQVFTDSDIPIVLIDTYNATIVDEPKIASHFRLFYNGPSARNYLTDIPDYEGEIGIEIRGAYSQTFPQLSYGFELRNAAGGDLDTGLLGMPAEHDWCLISTYNDKAFSRNLLAGHLFTSMGNYAPRARFCEVVINGDYKGIYILCEKIKRDNNRVDVTKLDSTEITYPDVSGGYIIKNDYWNASDSWQTNYGPVDHPTFDVHLVYEYPSPQNIQVLQQAYIQGFINQFETALYAPNFADPVNGYRQYVNELSFVDYFIVNELSRNYDGFMHSFNFHKDKDGSTVSKLNCGPVWDFDWAFKNLTIPFCPEFAAGDGSGWAYLINDCPTHGINSVGWHVRMMQDTGFVNLLRCRWDQLRQTVLDTAYVFHLVDSVAGYLNEAQVRHYARWGHITYDVGNCHVPPVPSTFTGHVDELKNWLLIRINWLDINMPGSSANCTLGTGEVDDNVSTVSLLPNPANDQVLIKTAGFSSALHITCFDQTGRTVLDNSSATSEIYTLDVSGLSNGIYLLQLKDQTGKQACCKLVISH
jgi:hypothetical protein